MPQPTHETIEAKLVFLYGPEKGQACYARLVELLDTFQSRIGKRDISTTGQLTERDVVLITYADSLKQPGVAPLATLAQFLSTHLKDVVNTVHILPFFPYSSDDGFSVIDYRTVDPPLGTWDDIHRLTENFNLMVDAVVNHISAESAWFQGFLRGDERYRDYFITVDPNTDLSMVVRPRALPLLTPVQTASGERHVWTTFSADQIDLNYANPEVLLAIIDVLLFYVEQGAGIIRLDAIAYLWKEIGTSCIHLPQTHAVVQLLRAILEDVAPWVLLITETNVPHEENISYFGDGTDEAHLVYQFPLPPLIAHTLLTGNATRLTEWAAQLAFPSSQTTFFNFTASHDGVGLRPATGVLSEAEIKQLVDTTKANGGNVSFKTDADGSTSPYELNITYFDLLNPPHADESLDLQVRRFLASQAIVLALAGVPGIYVHSLLGSRNDVAGVAQAGHLRAINREKLDVAEVEASLAETGSRRHAVLNGYKRLLQKRIQEKAFHPNGEQRVLSFSKSVFAVLRIAPDGDEAIAALHNVSANRQVLTLGVEDLSLGSVTLLEDVLSEKSYTNQSSEGLTLNVDPLQAIWLKLRIE